jgi:hypothetical protein
MQAMTDTSPEIAEMVRARLMARSGAERFRMGAEMFEREELTGNELAGRVQNAQRGSLQQVAIK